MHRNTYVTAVLVYLALLVGTEAALGVLKTRSGFYELFDRQITSREVLADLLEAGVRRSDRPKVVVLGDSVIYGSGLHANGVADWRRQTLPVFLQRELPGYDCIDLSMDGALPMDYLAVYQRIRRVRPEWVILDLNYRMSAQEYQQGKGSLSRPWLRADLPGDAFGIPDPATAGDRALEQLRRHSLLFRYSEAARSKLFFPSREEVFNRLLRRILPASALRPTGDAEMLLKFKLKPYYGTRPLMAGDNQPRALAAFLAQMRQDGQNWIVFSTPQNLAFLEDIWDEGAYRTNSRYLTDVVTRYADQKRWLYLDWSEKYEEGAFFDHCHLRPEFNQAQARDLAAVILSVPGGKRAQTAQAAPR